jgi:hypothetical protein
MYPTTYDGARCQLNHVSFAGVDDKVSLCDLKWISSRYPTNSIEWSLLYVPGKEGQPRNPTPAYRQAFLEADFGQRDSVHFCGKEAFDQILENQVPADITSYASRWQLNANARGPDFTEDQLIGIYHRALDQAPEIIVQCHGQTLGPILKFINRLTSEDRARVIVLLDESRGKGVEPSREGWKAMKDVVWNQFLNMRLVGYAGGINPVNVETTLESLLTFDMDIYIDMESGVRTDNQFDLFKVIQVMKIASLYFRDVG